MMRLVSLLLVIVSGCSFDVQPVDASTDLNNDGDVSSKDGDVFADAGAVDQARSIDLRAPQDMSELPDLTVLPDLVTPPDLMPPIPTFTKNVQPDLDRLTCGRASCHDSYSPLLVLNPTTGAQLMQNYTNIKTAVMHPNYTLSLLVQKTIAIASGGVTHGGDNPGTHPFANTLDDTYQSWLSWMAANTPY